ncbi:hypothetical protein [Joostella sp.]|uniref:hypothetical protein n=1 Tax=Joostella sp. TaxID=2231138 RepID=UPI003A9249B4
MKGTEAHNKVVEAWSKTPDGVKGIVFKNGWKRQTVSDIIREGRVDVEIYNSLISDIKKANKQFAKEVTKANDFIQNL